MEKSIERGKHRHSKRLLPDMVSPLDTNFEEGSIDSRWVPPWLVTLAKSLHLPLFNSEFGTVSALESSLGYVSISTFLNFLQGAPCTVASQLSFSNLCVPVGSFVSYVLANSSRENAVKTHLSISLYDFEFGLEVTAPPPPPAPNIILEVFGISKYRVRRSSCKASSECWLLSPAFVAFSYDLIVWELDCGLDILAPPPPPAPNIVLKEYSLSRLRKSMCKAVSFCPRKLSGLETVARKRYGVVFDGTVTQVHIFYAFVVACLNASLESSSLLDFIRLGSFDIRRHGWEFNSIHRKCHETWKTVVYVYFLLRHVVQGLYPDLQLWFVNLLIME